MVIKNYHRKLKKKKKNIENIKKRKMFFTVVTHVVRKYAKTRTKELSVLCIIAGTLLVKDNCGDPMRSLGNERELGIGNPENKTKTK